jgi:Icc-related predicted phosphoesterase
MKIQIVSDLHLEFADCNIKNENNADVLILSGDILVAQDLHDHPETDYGMYSNANLADLGRRQRTALRFRDFLKRCSFQFPKVLYIAGNHEFYHGKFPESIEHLRAECAKFPNVHFLEMDTITIDDVTFIGGTLWTDMNRGDPLTMHAISDMMNDFRVVRNSQRNYARFSPQDAAIRHRETLAYIKLMVAEKHDTKFVVVGHHSPSFQSVHEFYKHDTVMNGGYHSELSEFIMDRPQIKLWTHGHTHHCFDYVIGETRIVCNPRGYDGHEDTGWDPNKIVEI